MKKKNVSNEYIKQFYKKNKINFVVAFLEVLLITAGTLVLSWLLQQTTDLIAGNNTTFKLQDLALIALFLFIGCLGAYWISYFSKPKFITKGISQYKEYIFEKITKKNISAFIGEGSSKYISSLTNDIATIEKGYLWNTFDIVANILLFVGSLTLMFIYNWLLTLIALGLSIIPIVITIILGNYMAKAEKKVSDQNETYTATIKDTLSGFSVIKAFKVEAEMIKNFKNNVKRLATCQSRKYKIQILMEMAGLAAALLVQIGIFLIGAYLAISGKGVTAGTTIVFVQLLNFILNPIQIVPKSLAERKAAKALIEKIALEIEQNVREEKTSNINKLEAGIKINNLSFGYTEEKEILHNVSLNFELGKKYAIVGTSGSGKSTLLNLLMASNDNYKGNICYDNIEIKDISSDNLYNIESIIQQTVFIFNASIKNNITMFQEFKEEDIEKAINLSGLRTLVNEKGLDYICGENGSGLSGGEKQRISIARCLLRKTQILLVDEATAALDAETAYQVSNSILNLNGVTSIVVTHSLEEALLKKYDEIITLKNGSIIESGTFDTLINNKGYFYSLFTVSQ